MRVGCGSIWLVMDFPSSLRYLLGEILATDPTPTLLVRADGTIAYSNPAATASFPRSQDCEHIADMLQLDRQQDTLVSRLLDRATNGEGIDARLFVYGEDDALRPMRVCGHGAPDADGIILLRFTADQQDSSSLDEGDMAATRTHAEAIIHAIPSGLLLLDSDGTILFENTELKRMMAVPETWPSPVLGRKLQDLPGVQNTGLSYLVIKALGGTPITPTITPYRSVTGHNLTVRVQAVPLRTDGDAISGVILIVEDVTEQATLERKLIESQRLEAVGRLAAGVAHDFNNLLESMRAVAETMGSHETGAKGRIIGLSERGAAVTRRLLTLLRHEPTVRRVIDIRKVLHQGAELLRSTLGPHYTVRVDSVDGPLHVLGDPELLNQVLLNLGTNARDAMPSGGTIQIGASRCTVEHADLDVPHLRLWMVDEGQGVADEFLPKIFDAFATTKRRGFGTGLGLNISKEIVANHGGVIQANNKEPLGFEIAFCLPLSSGGQAESFESNPELSAIDGSGRRLLLVEDEPELLDALERLLRREGWNVVIATNGADAMECVNYDPDIAIAIIDLLLPDTSGDELLSLLRTVVPDLPAVIVSGFADDDRMKAIDALSFARFLGKPFPIEVLHSEIRRVLGVPEEG